MSLTPFVFLVFTSHVESLSEFTTIANSSPHLRQNGEKSSQVIPDACRRPKILMQAHSKLYWKLLMSYEVKVKHQFVTLRTRKSFELRENRDPVIVSLFCMA